MSESLKPRDLSEVQRQAIVELLRVFPVIDELGARFHRAGHELHLVGGSVRDALLGRLGDDLDFATSATPDADPGGAVRLGGVDLGDRPRVRHDRRGPTRAPPGDHHVPGGERTTGSAATRSSGTARASWTTCGRRDFTVNAMAVSVPGHAFTDPYGGLADLAAQVLDTPGTPESSFADDPLRMLRAARFAAQLGFAVRPEVIVGDDRDGGRPGPDHRGADPGRVHQAAAAARIRSPVCGCWSTPAWPTGSCPSCPGCGWRSTSTPSTRTSTSTR